MLRQVHWARRTAVEVPALVTDLDRIAAVVRNLAPEHLWARRPMVWPVASTGPPNSGSTLLRRAGGTGAAAGADRRRSPARTHPAPPLVPVAGSMRPARRGNDRPVRPGRCLIVQPRARPSRVCTTAAGRILLHKGGSARAVGACRRAPGLVRKSSNQCVHASSVLSEVSHVRPLKGRVLRKVREQARGHRRVLARSTEDVLQHVAVCMILIEGRERLQVETVEKAHDVRPLGKVFGELGVE